MPEIKPEQLMLIAGFILPGAISMYVYGLKVPQKEFKLQERVAEAICFSLLNFMLVGLPTLAILDSDWVARRFWVEWLLPIAGFVIAPVAWPFILVALLQSAEARGWIAVRAKTAWDDYFSRHRRGCWIQVELTDGRIVGGRFDRDSYASAFPDPGHLYIEELWQIDENGNFTGRLPGGAGVLLRPSDYRLVRVFTGAEQ